MQRGPSFNRQLADRLQTVRSCTQPCGSEQSAAFSTHSYIPQLLSLAAFWVGLVIMLYITVLDVRAGSRPQAAAVQWLVTNLGPVVVWVGTCALTPLLHRLRW